MSIRRRRVAAVAVLNFSAGSRLNSVIGDLCSCMRLQPISIRYDETKNTAPDKERLKEADPNEGFSIKVLIHSL